VILLATGIVQLAMEQERVTEQAYRRFSTHLDLKYLVPHAVVQASVKNAAAREKSKLAVKVNLSGCR
jgi:hypothetical protein